MMRFRRVKTWVAAAFTAAVLLVPASPAAAQAAWYDGLIAYSDITNCFSVIQGSPYTERGAGAFVGFLANPTAARPAPNITYYLHVYVAGLGNSCSGMRAFIDIALPPNTTLAIDGANPVYCYVGGAQFTGADCPQSLPPSLWNPGAFAILSTDNAHAQTWPLPPGGTWEFQIPVRSSTTLSGQNMQANVWMLDGNDSPWLRPTQGVYVFSNQPTIVYPTPSTKNIATTTALSSAYLFTNDPNISGVGWFDLGTTTAYELVHESINIPGVLTPGLAYEGYDQWGPPPLLPDTLYHWRFYFVQNGGPTIYGADQTFRTLPDGRVTVGTGAAASCTEAAFAAAFAAPGTKQIVFNCGALPITIPITISRAVLSPPFPTLRIDGGNKVTLARTGSGNHFDVGPGATLTLEKITLSGGSNTGFFSTCGGAVNVAAGAQLNLNEARFLNNQSTYQGGAVCNSGTLTVTSSFFSDNGTISSHGGAIGNYGTLTVTNSRFLNNRAAINGGAIDTVGLANISGSLFGANFAGFRGGAINTYVGTLNVLGSSFISNSAGLYGGGVASDGSVTTIVGSTLASNSSLNHGGGIEISGDGSLALTNSTLSENTAVTEGGGVYWTPKSTAGLTILNATIADNSAVTTGGSIFTGTVGAYTGEIIVKNSIVAGGTPGNCSGTVQSSGNNLENTNTCGFKQPSDKLNTGANLGPLANGGGAIQVRPPLPGSQAIDNGTNTGCPGADQQGVSRPRDGDGNGSTICDIGAVEVAYPTPTITRVLPDGGPTSGGQSVTITGTNLSGATATIGGVAAAVSGSTATTLTVTTPAHAAGAVDVVVVNGAFGGATAALAYTYFPLLAPATMTATAASASQVALNWGAVGGATSYDVFRSTHGAPFTLLINTASTSASDTGLSPNTAYLYKVRAVVGGSTSGFSPTDAATTVVYTGGLAAGMPIRAVHLTELRTAVNALRVAAGLDVAILTDGTVSAGVTAARRAHLIELRVALNAARSAIGMAVLPFSPAAITARSTVISAAHLAELQAGTQ